MARKQPSGAILREFLSKVGAGQAALPYRKKQLIYRGFLDHLLEILSLPVRPQL